MPPRAKFTKEEIINAGLEILKEKDLSSVTAREIGKRLKSSSRPIFTTFQNMNEVMEGIKDKAREIYTEYVQQGLKEAIAFRGVGQAYIMFAIKEPKLFQLLFMNKQKEDLGVNKILPEIESNYDEIVSSITDNYPVSKDAAISLYRHLWIYSHGIATLCANGMCKFSGEEIANMLTEVFKSLLKEKLGK